MEKRNLLSINVYNGDYESYALRHLEMMVDGHAVGLTTIMAINTFL